MPQPLPDYYNPRQAYSDKLSAPALPQGELRRDPSVLASLGDYTGNTMGMGGLGKLMEVAGHGSWGDRPALNNAALMARAAPDVAMLAGQGVGLKSAAQGFSRASKPLVEMGFKALGGQTGRELGQAGLNLIGQSGNAATMVTGDPRYANMASAMGLVGRGIPDLVKREMTVGRRAPGLSQEQKQAAAMAERMWKELREQGVHPDKIAAIIKRETGWHPVPQGANKPVEFGLEISDRLLRAA